MHTTGVGLSVAGAVARGAPTGESTEQSEGAWDSQGKNPTHTQMAEWAIADVSKDLPEVRTYAEQIFEGVNLELHDEEIKNHEALRREIGGNNWAADHPEIFWRKARDAYTAKDAGKANFYVGILLHYVQDMGVPAHAFHIVHQNKPLNMDNMEMHGFFRFRADMNSESTPDPQLGDPVFYIEWSAQLARDQFTSRFPGETYDRHFYPERNNEVSSVQWDFLERRETDCTRATAYALRSAARAWAGKKAR